MRYSAYKDSGIPWLGELPTTWSCRRIKSVARLITEKSEGSEFVIGLENIVGWTGQIIESGGTFEGQGIAFHIGDVLFGKLRPYLAKAWTADRPGAAVGDFHILRSSGAIEPRFLNYCLLIPPIIDVIDGSTFGAKMPRVSWQFLGCLEIALPGNPSEQRAVVTFLDRETSKLDELIAKQKALIERLGERRRAAIDLAVTRTRDPSMPARRAAFEDLKEIPLAWELRPFLQCFTGRVDYRGATPRKTESGVPLVTARNVKQGYIDYSLSEEFVSVEEYGTIMRRGLPELGDVLMTMEAPLGNVALVDRTDVAFAQRVVKFRPLRSSVDPDFLCLAMNSAYFQSQLERRATGSTALGIKASKLHGLRVALPPLTEQRVIARSLRQANGQSDALVAKALSAIGLLQERRSALITAAVTGKIDVRGAA